MSYYSAKPAMTPSRQANPSAAPWLILAAAVAVGAGAYYASTQKAQAKPPKVGPSPDPEPDPDPEPSARIRVLTDDDMRDKIQFKRMADTRRPLVFVQMCDIPEESKNTIMDFYQEAANKPEASGVDFYVTTDESVVRQLCGPDDGALVVSMRLSGLDVQYISREAPKPGSGTGFGNPLDPTVKSVLTEAVDFAIGIITPAQHTQVPLDSIL